MSTPEQLGKYKIVRVIGKGAMGIVYEGFDPVIERTVAIKTIRMDELDESEAEEHSRRFRVEAKAAGKLNHPNIVGIYDYGEEQNLAYIVMEYVQGKELKSYLDSGQRFPMKQVVNIMTQLLEALGYSHARGVIHRDIKPANLFITEDGTVKLGDFGIARIDSTHKTHAGTVLGTPSYMSPEQIKGEAVDNRSDLYSSGVILYQFLTGEKPFTGSMVAVMHKVLTEPPPKPSSLNPQVTAKMEQVVAKAMAKEPDDRYANARAFIEALRAAVGPEPVEDDAEATRIIDMSEFRAAAAATAAADKTARSAADATGQTARTANLADSEIEIEFWRSIKDSADADDFEIYLKKYPQGHYAELAQLKLNKLRRADATQSPASARAADDTAAGRTGGSRIEDIRRKAEEARRKAEEEMRRAEEELQRAEEAQHKAEEEARAKAAKLNADLNDLCDAAAAFTTKVKDVLAADRIKEAREEVRGEAAGLLQEADDVQARLQDLLKNPDLLSPAALKQADQDRDRCAEATAIARAAEQDFEAAFKRRLDEIQRNVEIVTRHGHDASQALQETERLAEAARQAGMTAQALAGIQAAAQRMRGITGDARKHIEIVLRDQELLQPEVLKTVQTAEMAYGRAEAKAQETVAQAEAALEEARRQAEEEARRKAEEEARRKAEEEARRKAEEEARRKAEEDAKRKAEEDARRKAEEDAKRQAEAEAKRQAEEDARRKAEADAKRKAEEDAKRKAEEDARRKAEEDAKRKAEEDARRKAEEDARRKAEEDAKRKAEEDAKRQAEEDAKRKAEADTKRQAEEDAKRKAEEDTKRQAEADAKRQAEENAKRKAEADAKRKAEEDTKRQAEADAKRKAEEDTKRQAEADARRKAEEDAKRKTEEDAKRQAEEDTKRQAEADAKRQAEEDAKRKAEADAKRKAEEDAKRQAEAEAKRKAEEDTKRQAEADAKRRAEEDAADETMVAPASIRREMPDSDATIMAPPGPRQPTGRPAERASPTTVPTPEKKGLPVVPIAIGGVVIAGVVGWLMMKGPSEPESPIPAIPPTERPGPSAPPAPPAPGPDTQAAAQQAEAAKQAALAARQQAEEQQRKLAEAQKAAEDAKRMAEEAKRMGDAKQAEEARRKAEVEMRKAEEARQKAADDARRAEEEAKRRAADEARLKAEAEARRKAELEAQRKAAAEAEAQRKAAAEAEAQRKAAAEAEAQRKAAAEAEAQRKAAAEARPSAGGTPSELFQQARNLEGEGRFAEAVRTYKQAANAGYGPASKRLGEIYLKGAKGVSRDYAESVRWYDKARQQGMDIPN